MTLELSVAVIVAIISLGFNVYQYQKKTHTEGGHNSAVVTAKLDNIAGDVTEIKQEIKTIRNDWMKDHETLILIQRDMKSVWKRIDEINERNSKSP